MMMSALIPHKECGPIGAILLAAGRGSRMRGSDKLLARIGQYSLIEISASALKKSKAELAVAVCGHNFEKITPFLDDIGIAHIINPDFKEGISTSIRAGIGWLMERRASAVLMLLADMPEISAATINHIIASYQSARPNSIIIATDKGKWGHPVLFPQVFFPTLLTLTGDRGARQLLQENCDHIVPVEIGGKAHLDLDTQEALMAYRNMLGAPRA